MSDDENKKVTILGQIFGGAVMGCLTGGTILLMLVVLVGLVRLLGWLVSL